PTLPLAKIMPADEANRSTPNQQQPHMQPAARACTQHKQRDQQFNTSEQSKEAAAQSERFHGLRFNDAAQKLADSLVANLIRLKPQCSKQEPLLENGACESGNHTLRPGHEQSEWHQTEQQQRPSQ